MFEDEFEQFSAMARRGSLPLPESPIIMIEHSPRRSKSLKGNRKKKEFVMSPLVREENTDKDAESSSDNNCDTQQLLKVPQAEPVMTVPKITGSHSRSSSCKKAKNPRNLQLQIESRPRSSSLPNVQEPNFLSPFSALQGAQNDTYRVRCFCTTSKGIVNKGDSIVRAKSNSSMVSAASYGSGLNLLIEDRRLSLNSQGSATHSAASSTSGETPVYKVIVMGKDGVGKTAVTQQFMTSEDMGAQNTSFDDEEEKTVSVLLDEEESIMDIVDAPDGEGYEGYEDADAYVVVYSITDISSFQFATDLIRKVREQGEGGTKHVAVILVANKSDLVRGRTVSEEAGKTIATLYEAKYIEISVVLNHNVDELLVGILSQIRLNVKRSEKQRRKDKKGKDSNCVNKAAKGLINRLIKRPTFSKSCDNLLVL